ncbi:uncharacterized protein LOC127655265 isoform X13 [Xyrauchen texanus]|uniref:uncharacterized protein LOC127655265 isoform X13 n=1 Tax=Xyrauchen texanus TaxID=154827 RepID=UPI0022424B5B|nr:uncharacterized protein LOC127655265 isoform X13 [Xyrauchen texanus]
MTALWKAFCLFICLTLTRLDSGICVIYVESGKSGNLNPNIQGKPEDILWTFNGNKAAEHDLSELYEYGQFKERTTINFSTGHLTVRQMTHSDSGVYKSTIQIKGILHLSAHDVQVIDAVPEPSVTCKVNHTTELKSLFCSVDSQFPAAYEWIGSNAAHQPGQELYISKEENPDTVYTCTVKNQVSQKSNSLSLKECNTDGSQLALKNNLLIIIVVVVVVVVVVFVFIIGIIIYSIKKKKKRSAEQGEESMEHMELLQDGPSLYVNQSKNHDVEQNSKKEKSEYEDESVHKHEGAQRVNEDKQSESDKNAKCSEDNEESISDVNQSKNHDVEQNSKKEKSEYEDESVHKHEGAQRVNEDKQSESDKNAKCSEDNEESISDVNQSKNHDVEQNSKKEKSEYEDESVHKHEGAQRVNEDKQSESDKNAKCSEDNEESISEQNSKKEKSEYEDESVHKHEGAQRVNEDKQSESYKNAKCSEDNEESISDVNQSKSHDVEQNSKKEKSEYEDESVHKHEGSARVNEDKQSESDKNAKCSEDNEESISEDLNVKEKNIIDTPPNHK